MRLNLGSVCRVGEEIQIDARPWRDERAAACPREQDACDRLRGLNAPFPASKEPSEALGVAVGPFDRVYGGGYRMFGGSPEAWAVHLHP